MTTLLAFIAAAAVGAVLRYLFAEMGNSGLPVGTLVVNLVASFVMGLAAARVETSSVAFQLGLLGTMSTWSTLAHEVAVLARARRGFEALMYLSVSVVFGILCAWLGLSISG